VVVEESAPKGPPPFSIPVGIRQGCGQGTRSRSRGAMTRMIGSKPTVSSQ
jgi:hypothetical protein